ELRLNGAFADGKVEYTLGGYYSDQQSRYAGTVDLRWAGVQFRQDDPVPASTAALFAHASWHLTDALTLTGGIRYTDEKKDYTFYRQNLDGTANPPLVGILDGYTGSYKGDRIDYRINAQYRWSDSLMTYAQFSTGFKGGGVNPRPYFIEQVQPFEMETID